MATIDTAIANWTKAVKDGKMTTLEAIRAAQFAMWNFDRFMADHLINMRDVTSQVEIANAARRYMHNMTNPTEFERVAIFWYRMRWLAAAPVASATRSRDEITNPNEVETCGRCGGSGIYRGAGVVENGVFKGYQGTCYRCKGKGKCTRLQNEMGERGRGDYAAGQMVAELRAHDRQHNHDEETSTAVECVDCGTAPAGSIRVYCPDHAKARYNERTGRFDHGDTIPTHDETIGREWEGGVSRHARNRAERRERYTAQKPDFRKIGIAS